MGETGTDGERFIDNKSITGAIPDMLEEAVEFVRTNSRTKTIIDDKGKRVDKTEYPVKAVREAILNALVHRDYSIYTENTPIRIEMYRDRMEVTNSGGLYGKISIDALGKVHPETRNAALANMLELLNITENRYSGIPTMRRECLTAGLPAPDFSVKHGEFKVLMRNGYLNDSDSIEDSILAFCEIPRSRSESDMNIKTDETKALAACGFSRKGYDFAGWATSANGNKAYGDKSNYLMGSDSEYTLYALWAPTKYTITYNLNGGSVSNANKTEYTIESETFTLTNPTRPGYTFNGWTGSILSDKTYTVSISTGSTGNLSFTANYDANLNSLLFNANGGVGETPEMLIETDRTVKLNTCTFSRKGYDFVGWTTSQNGEKVYSDGQNYTMGVNSEYVLYAVWKIKTYTIEYHLNNGTAPSNKQSYTVETESFTLENPLRNGYTFIGWSGTDIADKSTTVTIGKGTIGNRKYTANWKANTNVLHFNPNGGDGIMDDMSIDTDDEKLLTANTFTRDGYKFKGWANVPKGSVVYLDTSSYRMGTASAYTLYAVWEANVNKLIFDGNGLTSGEMEEMSIKTDESVSLIDCGFTKTGYSFKGWAAETDGSVKYGNKAIYTMGAESSYTLYAVWEINQYTIILELNGGAADTDSITQNYNTVVEPPVVTRSGYNFVEWYADSEFNTIYNFSTIPAENITVYAKWQMKTEGDELTGIRTYDEFNEIRNHTDGNFYLINDITVDSSWEYIGTFSGSLNGNARKIIYVNENASAKKSFLFKENVGEIRNLIIELQLYNIDSSQTDYGFITTTNRGKIYDISLNGSIKFRVNVEGKVLSSSVNRQYYIGACIGIGENKIRSIKSFVDITYNAYYSKENASYSHTVYTYIGGIAGKTQEVSTCDVKSNINASLYVVNGSLNTTIYLPTVIGGVAGCCDIAKGVSYEGNLAVERATVGGIAGRLSGEISDCYSVLDITASVDYCGGLIGFAEDSIVYDCYAKVKFYVSSRSTAVCVAGLIGEADNSTISGCFVYVPVIGISKRRMIGYNREESTTNNCEYFDEEPNYYVVLNRIGWDMSTWVLGYGAPILNNGEYPIISYNNIPAEVLNENPNAYKPKSGELTLTSPQRVGYAFEGWFLDKNYNTKVEKIINITEPLTLYAKWMPNNYVITFNAVGGEVCNATATVTYDAEYTLEVPVRPGYTFLGWYDGTGNSAVAYTDETGKSLGKWNLTDGIPLYAQWQEA